jgi:hypothetical protein
MIAALLAQAGPSAVPSPVAVTVAISPSEPMVAVYVAAILSILGAVTAAITTIITLIRSGKTKAIVEGTHELNQAQNLKLDTITLLVNGRYGDVLQELADVKRILAAESGRKADKESATQAQTRADAQQARVAETKAKVIE